MNLKELKNNIDFICSKMCEGDAEEIKVCITTKNDSIGPRASVDIKNIYLGFDWEKNQLRIDTQEDIVLKKTSDQERLKTKLAIEKNNEYYCPCCNKKVTMWQRYCITCGQKMRGGK